MKNLSLLYLSGLKGNFLTLLNFNGWKTKKLSLHGENSLLIFTKSQKYLKKNTIKLLKEYKIGIKFIMEFWLMLSFLKMMKRKLEIANILVFYMGIWIAVISFLKDNKRFCMFLTQIRFKEDFIFGTFLKLFSLLWCFNRQECQLVELQFQKLTEKSSKVGSFKDMNQLLERAGLISKDSREW